MLVIKGKHSGFCFGVKRAVDTAKKLQGKNNYILGDLIHNDSVISDLKNRGITILNSIEEVCLTSKDTVLIRTHGEAKSVYDKLESYGVNIIDCTCPFVKEIQNIVQQHYENGYKIAIIGDASHPEVIGINGWCNNSALITENFQDLINLKEDKICVVVQTTYPLKKFDETIKNFAYDRAKTVDIFRTICYTTSSRQREAEIISKKCDAILVLGGSYSNNTKKLFDICQNNCNNVFRIISPSEFDYNKIKKYKKVGVVFGASTPEEQFQEVIQNMENNVTQEKILVATEEVENKEAEVVEQTKAPSTKSQKTEMEKAFDNIGPSRDFRVGQIVTAKISSVQSACLTVSIKDTKKDFEIQNEELLQVYDKDAIGKTIRVMVVGKSPLKFSEKAMEKVLKEESEIEEIKNGKIFETVISSVNKGGLIGKYNSYEVFVPASQIKLGFVKDLEKYVGKTLRLKAEKVESKGKRRQIVGSQKVILEAEKAERDAIKAAKEQEFFSNVQEGDVVLGTPVRFAAFGAFIDVNGFDCLAHISDLSWNGCKECSDVLEIGKQYEFKILKLDEENKRVSVGYKQLQPKPWETVLERYNVGDVVKGKVVRIVNFGAFVEIEKGIDGLVHVSQISNKWLENPVTALNVGDEVEAKIIDINPEKEKMTLSIKALAPEEAVEDAKEEKEVKSKKHSKVVEDAGEEELREWKDDNGGVSIADLINNN